MVGRENDHQGESSVGSRTQRRRFLKLAGAGAVATLAGCQGTGGDVEGESTATEGDTSGETTTTAPSNTDAGPDVDLSEWQSADINWRKYEGQDIVLALLRHPFVSVLEPLIPVFSELTGMQVNIVQYPEQEYRQKRLTDVSTGAGVFDAIMLGQPLLQYYEADWLQPLGEFINDDELYDADWYNMDDVVDAAMSIARGRGRFDDPIAMPATTEATLVFYRKDLYEEQSLEVPTTFDEYRNNAQVLDENYDMPGMIARGQKGYGMNMYPFSGYLRSFGSDHWTEYSSDSGFDTDSAIQAIDYYSSMLQNYGPDSPESYTWSDCLNQMSQGGAGHWGADTSYFYETLSDPNNSDVPEQIGLAPHPEGPGGVNPNTFSWLMAAPKKSARPGAAWLFMLFSTSEPTQRFLATEQGFPPVRNSLYSELEGSEYTDVVLPMIEQAQPSRWGPKFPEWGQRASANLQSIVAGDLSPEEGMTQTAQMMEQVLSE
jgi:ABC-type glycerol-3-phosphate transport system substrate-binding protein